MQPKNPEGPQSPKKKRERRRAPPFTLVWSEAVQTHPGITTSDVHELRRTALSLIQLAEAALRDDPSIYKLGMTTAQIADIVWAKFQVGDNWFCLELRRKEIREYVVNLTTPPAPDDIPPPPRDHMHDGRDHEAPPPGPDGPASVERNKADGSQGAFARISVLWRVTLRELNRSTALYKSKFRAVCRRTLDRVNDIYRSVSYNTGNLEAGIAVLSQRIASTIASCRSSFTHMREGPDRQVSSEARLEPRWVGQNSGICLRLYSWVRDEQAAIDWTTDLFGVLPIDWAANLFGVLPEEERAMI